MEVKGGEVHAETEVQLGDRTYTFPVVLTLGEDAWTYEVEKAGRFGDMFEVTPGGLVTPEVARRGPRRRVRDLAGAFGRTFARRGAADGA